jgi:hypothetical protein
VEREKNSMRTLPGGNGMALAFGREGLRLAADGSARNRALGSSQTRGAPMLTTLQKATILRKAGVEIPASPIRRPMAHDRHGSGSADAASGGHLPLTEAMQPGDGTFEHATPLALHRWAHEIDILFATYSAARAARSLREAEAARQTAMLRKLASSGTSPRSR